MQVAARQGDGRVELSEMRDEENNPFPEVQVPDPVLDVPQPIVNPPDSVVEAPQPHVNPPDPIVLIPAILNVLSPNQDNPEDRQSV